MHIATNLNALCPLTEYLLLIVNKMVLEYCSLRFVFCSDTLTYDLQDSDCMLLISGAVLWNYIACH